MKEKYKAGSIITTATPNIKELDLPLRTLFDGFSQPSLVAVKTFSAGGALTRRLELRSRTELTHWTG